MVRVFARDDGSFREVPGRPLKDEAELQRLLAEHDSLIPWSLDSRRVVAREVMTRAGPIDHVAVDAAGQILIVETKLARNASRRQVVAQAVDYASQLTRSGPIALVDQLVERVGRDFTMDWFPSTPERDIFLRALEANLRQGHVTMLIVMDEAEELLKDSVRFLNRSASFNCILAEIRVAEVAGHELVLVETYGEESAEEKASSTSPSGSRPREEIDEEQFVAEQAQLGLGAEARAFIRAVEWARAEGAVVKHRARGWVVGYGYSLMWQAGTSRLDIWATASKYESRRAHLERAPDPWRKRITTYPPSPGKTYGKVAEVDPHGADEEAFRNLLAYYLKGPQSTPDDP